MCDVDRKTYWIYIKYGLIINMRYIKCMGTCIFGMDLTMDNTGRNV